MAAKLKPLGAVAPAVTAAPTGQVGLDRLRAFYAGYFVSRVGVGTGVYTLGSPREIEFGLHITF